jgi:hypothetical protein
MRQGESMENFTAVVHGTTQEHTGSHRTEHGVLLLFLGLVLALYAVIGYGIYSALVALL